MTYLEQHRCVPIKNGRKMQKTVRGHSPTHAGFDVITVEYDETECPLCHRTYPIGDPVVCKREFEPYEAPSK